MEKYYYRLKGHVKGPLSVMELRKLSEWHQFGRHYDVSSDGINWSRAGEHPELFPTGTTPSRPLPATLDEQATAEFTYEEAPVEEAAASPPSMVYEAPLNSVETDNSNDYFSQPVTAEEVTDFTSPAATQAGGDEPTWYYTHNGREVGPVTIQDLGTRAHLNQLGASDYVWCYGMPDWVPAAEIPTLSHVFASSANMSPMAESPDQPVSSLATNSLVLGLLGATILLFFGSIAAVVTGHMAMAEIQRSEGRLGGKTQATAGLVLGYFVIAAALVTSVVLIVLKLKRGG